MTDIGDNRFKPHPDYTRLQDLFPQVRELQKLAKEHGVPDIFQDNGGKILQLALLLGIKLLPGRKGNDAVDVTTKGEFELKTLNIDNKGGFTTHHHLNHDILAKYRTVEWIFATYESIEIRRVWLLTPQQMESWFEFWERRLDTPNKEGVKPGHLNNPKIRKTFVAEHGDLLFEVPGFVESTKPRRGGKTIKGLRDTSSLLFTNPPYSRKERKT